MACYTVMRATPYCLASSVPEGSFAPVRLTGEVSTLNPATGEILHRYSSGMSPGIGALASPSTPAPTTTPATSCGTPTRARCGTASGSTSGGT
jgi:hypothetical protein